VATKLVHDSQGGTLNGRGYVISTGVFRPTSPSSSLFLCARSPALDAKDWKTYYVPSYEILPSLPRPLVLSFFQFCSFLYIHIPIRHPPFPLRSVFPLYQLPQIHTTDHHDLLG
jgi:hypothetical protein